MLNATSQIEGRNSFLFKNIKVEYLPLTLDDQYPNRVGAAVGLSPPGIAIGSLGLEEVLLAGLC